MAFEDCKSTVELFQQNYARQLVGQGHFAERKQERGGVPGLGAEAISRTDGKDEVLSCANLMAFEQFGQFFRRELPSTDIEQHQRGRRFGALHQLQKGDLGGEFNGLGIAVMREARKVFVGEIANGG